MDPQSPKPKTEHPKADTPQFISYLCVPGWMKTPEGPRLYEVSLVGGAALFPDGHWVSIDKASIQRLAETVRAFEAQQLGISIGHSITSGIARTRIPVRGMCQKVRRLARLLRRGGSELGGGIGVSSRKRVFFL